MSLSVRGATKRFGALVANDDINLELAPGDLHAVFGENGAGKSTLMKLIAGTMRQDSGEILMNGEAILHGSQAAALAAGVGMLAQEPLVCLPFSNRENFRLGSDWGLDQASHLLRQQSEKLGFRLDPGAITRSMSVGERQQLEMVRLLARGIKLLILDEPTSGLTGQQRDQLFAALQRLSGEGLMVLFVSHKLEEVNELCRTVTVMRRGRIVGETSLPKHEAELVALMFEQTAPAQARAPIASDGSTAVELSGVDAGFGRQTIAGVDLAVGRGEVIGIAGLEGSGQAALVRALSGQVTLKKGRLTVAGRDLTNRRLREFRKHGVAFLPCGRLEEGLIPELSIAEHLELVDGTRFLIDWDHARTRSQASIETFRIKGAPDTTVDELSGGNQQRVLLSLLPPKLALLVMEQPTRGLDVESAAYIWNRLLERRRQGTAIVFASSDLDEVLAYSDRVLVVFDGQVIANRTVAELDSDKLGTLIGGVVAA
ncbi:ATP-binding cassette domain-containing protein [soil metagenome]